MERGGAVYIMTNKYRKTLYVGVTSNLLGRVLEHKEHIYRNSFTHRYNLDYLVYYENFYSIEEAIAREKEIKKWRKEKKEKLINEMNPEWNDLWDEIQDW